MYDTLKCICTYELMYELALIKQHNLYFEKNEGTFSKYL